MDEIRVRRLALFQPRTTPSAELYFDSFFSTKSTDTHRGHDKSQNDPQLALEMVSQGGWHCLVQHFENGHGVHGHGVCVCILFNLYNLRPGPIRHARTAGLASRLDPGPRPTWPGLGSTGLSLGRARAQPDPGPSGLSQRIFVRCCRSLTHILRQGREQIHPPSNDSLLIIIKDGTKDEPSYGH
jgi:hypothetical protein